MLDFLNPLISAAAGLGGVFLGGYLSDRREREKRRNDFITRQLAEFYGPLVSMRAEIQARSALRLKIQTAQDQNHMNDLLDAQLHGGPNAVKEMNDDNIPPMLDVMRDEYKIFTDVMMPLYRNMLQTFRDRMWLAETETRDYLPALVEFVDVWERHLRGTMPGEVLLEINHTEQNLHPFYDHLKSTHDRLRHVLAA
jgi:hypothetical protein